MWYNKDKLTKGLNNKMVKKLKALLLTVASTGALLSPALVPATVSAVTTDPSADVIKDGLCEGTDLLILEGTTTQCDPATSDAESRVNEIIRTVINIFSLIVGVVAVIMIIVGGLKYITSSGDSGNVTSAKNTILYAIIGLVIVALAQIIVRFVLQRATTTAS